MPLAPLPLLLSHVLDIACFPAAAFARRHRLHGPLQVVPPPPNDAELNARSNAPNRAQNEPPQRVSELAGAHRRVTGSPE